MNIIVWYIQNNSTYYRELRHLKPRRYMCGWSFKQLLKYVSKELEWEDIEKDSICAIAIINKKEHWECSVRKEQGE